MASKVVLSNDENSSAVFGIVWPYGLMSRNFVQEVRPDAHIANMYIILFILFRFLDFARNDIDGSLEMTLNGTLDDQSLKG